VSPNYADVAITEYFRALGIAYPADLSRDGGDFFAIRTVLEYLAPARFDDLLEIGVRVGRLGRSSLSSNLGIWRGGEALTAGEVIYVHAPTAPAVTAGLYRSGCATRCAAMSTARLRNSPYRPIEGASTA
jgi:acyl-CoA thioester hydrolase